MNIDVEINEKKFQVTFIIEGNINLYEAYKFKEKINDYIHTKYRVIILNLKSTYNIDSSGIGAIISLSNMAKEIEIDLILENLSEELKNVFNLLKVYDILHIR